jgi:hypothetical protein
MANFSERAKDWWEGKAPRERRLLAILGTTLVVCVVAWVTMTIRGGLSAIEKKNDRAREALSAIDLHRRVAAQKAEPTARQITIPTTPVDLATYVDGIITEVQLKSPTYPTPKETPKGEHVELSFHIVLQDLTITQLEQLLEKIETKNPVVVVTELKVSHPNYREQDKLDVDMTIATFYKKGAAPAPAAPGGAGTPAEGKEG